MSDTNQEQIEFWNGEAAETWVRSQAQVDAMLAPLSEIALARANPRPGERAIDIGCGCGTTTLALAEQGTSVWGIDVSVPMLAHARGRAQGLDNVAFSQTDAATQTYTPDHQLLFSRFGVMFFDDPAAAFANLRTALTEDGRLVFICWQKPSANAWMSVAGQAVQPFLPQPATPPDPQAPGPFAFADPDYIRDLLLEAGYVRISVESVTTLLHLGDDLDSVMAAQSEIGPLARAIAELEGESRDQALAAARQALAPHVTDAGLDLGAACWLVAAHYG